MNQSSNIWNRRRFLAAVGATVAASGVRRSFGASAKGGPRRPNVLVMQPDQHSGLIMGCAGHKQIRTPNLDRLAARGINFTHCASSGPVCSPYRATTQTGLYPHVHRVVKNNIRMKADVTTIAELFADAGYATGYIGKWHIDGGLPKAEGGEGVTSKAVGGFVPESRRRGYQEWRGYEKSHEYFEVWTYTEDAKKVRVKGYDWEPTWHTDVFLDFAKRHADEPWLYHVAYGPPHLPEQAPTRFLDMYPPDSLELPPDVEATLPDERKDELRRHMQMYFAQVSAVDEEVGRVIDGLEKLGLADDTIVLYTSDHGDVLGSHSGASGKLRGKGKPVNTAFRIPCLLSYPRRVKPGQTRDELVSSVDFVQTLLELAGLKSLPEMQGLSHAPLALTGKGPTRDAVYLGLGDNQPIPREAFEKTGGAVDPLASMKLVTQKALPAGEGHGTSAKKTNTKNWQSGYDEEIVVDLKPGKHTVAIKHSGKGRTELEYILRGYVDGKPEFKLPTSDKWNFKTPPVTEFTIARDGLFNGAQSLRPHLYGSPERVETATFRLDCARPAKFVVHVTASIGAESNKLLVYMDEKKTPKKQIAAKKPSWWRAVWDGRYVYKPGAGGWLYDHREDPCEMVNLIASPSHADVRKRLGKRLLAFAEETNDTVLEDLRAIL